jgi:hypothetical protein
MRLFGLSKLAELLEARVNSIPTRVRAGLATDSVTKAIELFTTRLEVWLVVPSSIEHDQIISWLRGKTLPFAKLEIYTLGKVNEVVAKLP